MSKMIYILNGPNLNLLGRRETEIYGHHRLQDIAAECFHIARRVNLQCRFLQSNHEDRLLTWIHEAYETASGIIINPAAFSHQSLAIFDALNSFPGPVIEIHLSNIYKREEFRHHSFVSKRADGVIVGLGHDGYALALENMAQRLASG